MKVRLLLDILTLVVIGTGIAQGEGKLFLALSFLVIIGKVLADQEIKELKGAGHS